MSVTGIAGIGKSRLAWEFYKYFDGIGQIVYWHRGRCLAYGEGVTYWALADMVRMRCRIAEDEPQDEALRKLRRRWTSTCSTPEERRFVEPRLAQLLALGEARSRDRQDLFAAWRLFFERLADTYPTVLAFEDMQWADAACSTSSSTCSSGRATSRSSWSRWRGRSCRSAGRPGAPGTQLRLALPGAALARRRWRSCSSGSYPGLPAPLRDADPRAAPRASPCTRSRRCGCCSTAVCSCRTARATGRSARSTRSRCPRRLHALIAARLDGLSLRRSGGCSGRRRARARRSRRGAWPR